MGTLTENIEKISRVILQPVQNLQLKLSVKLSKENKINGKKESFHKLFTTEDKISYLNLDFYSSLTLELTTKPWSKDKSLLITMSNIYQIQFAFKKVLDNIYNGEIFAMDKNDNVIAYGGMCDKHTVRAFNIGFNQRLIIRPSVIYDENDISYEGVVMFINKTNNHIELTIDALESLYYALTKVDIFAYSQLLLNYYVSSVQNGKIELKNTVMESSKSRYKKHPLDLGNEKKEFVESTPKKEDKNDFFDYSK